MIEAIATVVATRAGYVSVEYQRASACGHCHHQSSCAISSGMDDGQGHGDHIIDIACILPLEIGQQVRVGIPENGLLKGALLVYILPLFFYHAGSRYRASIFCCRRRVACHSGCGSGRICRVHADASPIGQINQCRI